MLSRTTTFMMLVAVLLVASHSPSTNAQTAPSPAQPIRVSKEELDTRFARARQSAALHKYEAALEDYLFVFDNSRDVSSYGGVRLSYVPGEIAQMGRVYRPAILALQARRDQRQKKILAGAAEWVDVHEVTSLNEYLETPERNIELYDKVKMSTTAATEIKGDFLRLIWKQLVTARRYDDLKDQVNGLARGVVSQIAETVIDNDFPASDVRSEPMYQDYLRHSIIGDGGSVYEALLALGRDEPAKKLEKWLFTFAADGEMYAQLIGSAQRASRNSVATDLVNRALRTLKNSKDLELVREAAKGLPAGN